ncbi:HelD family protein [Streptomyces sp. NBC_01353]|uniref:HelD family protein n=1 Tax=Streptomyces sp. NBC_01353 TaxID=2903835 RepID=UPI002E3635A2|nr:AAA family ATPase [Streptomyces sp. NBC_01353]
MTSLDHELLQERTHHDACHAALARMAEDVAEQVVIGENAAASGADAEALGYHLRTQAKEFGEQPPGPLFFGRLDREAGQTHHIGRRRIAEHPAAPPLVVDWRAPVSRAYYQAGSHDPQGLVRRRRFGWAPYSLGDSADLTGLEDEYLTAGEDPGLSPLVSGEIERPRVGPMRDIAATIQPEQDDLVRSEPTASVCVQGAPGTGKTAVGLHRAAYLLYTHPQRVRRSGLLVLGPNRTFLSYISEVLPALGETGIRQSTVAEEVALHEVGAVDAETAARVKHDPRMAGVLRRALYARVVVPEGELALADGPLRLRIGPEKLAEIVMAVREEAPPYATGRERVRARVVRVLQLAAERRAGPLGNAWVRRIERARPVSAFVDACWPRTTPQEVLAEVLTDPRDAALSESERDAIRWTKAPRSHRSVKWSAADLVLLDEVAGLIARPEGYGHVVVDEAQDLSPMECRAIARRAVFGSLTVLGDLAQGTTPWAARDWRGQLAHLGKPEAEIVPLTTGYRVPAAIVELANRLLPELGTDVPAGRSLRADGEVTVARVADVAAGVVGAVRAALAKEGSVGVIAAEGQIGPLTRALEGTGGSRLTVLPATAAKGLEYDHVVVAEPAAIVAAEERGLHRLYVVLTRAVSRLDIVHSEPLPASLAGGQVPEGS